MGGVRDLVGENLSLFEILMFVHHGFFGINFYFQRYCIKVLFIWATEILHVPLHLLPEVSVLLASP